MRAPGRDAFWLRWYPGLLLATWVLIPELRRLVDWQVGFSSLPIINLIPTVALLPLAGIILQHRQAHLAHEFRLIAWLWIGAFTYALLVGLAAGSSIAAIYEFALFCPPLLVGLWIAGSDQQLGRRLFDRFARAALWLGVFTSAYGIYQFIAPPPWDVNWVLNADLASIGKPEPFGLRIFGTMNSAAALSDFLAMVILLTLHRLRARAMWLVLPLLVCAFALSLTFMRSAWLELALGLMVYLLLSPRRAAALATFAITVTLTAGLAMNLSFVTGDPTSNAQLQSRLGTLNDLQNDDSANEREQRVTIAFGASLAEPLGQGLGTVGTATKLSAAKSTTVLDSGYLTRLLEMGVFGALLYFAALVVGLVSTVTRLAAVYRSRNEAAAAVAATCVAVQVALIGAELSGDHHSSLMGILFWLVVGVSSTLRERLNEVRSPVGFQHRNRPARA